MTHPVFHEGTLFLDEYKRYSIRESRIVVIHQMITLTSGYTLQVWLNREWIVGCVEGDGQEYWLFAKSGGKFLLSEQMIVRYANPS